MGESILDVLFAIWRALDELIIASAMGLALIVGFPAFYFTQKTGTRSVLKALFSSLLVWAWFAVLGSGAWLFKGYSSNSYEGYGALIILPVFLFGAVLTLVSTLVLTLQHRMRWPAVACVSTVPAVFVWASLNRANYDWAGPSAEQTRNAEHRQEAWFSAHPLVRAVAKSNNQDFALELPRASREELDVEDSSGRTALHFAANNGHVAMVRSLLNAGAPQRRTDRGTPADLAADHANTECLELLLSAGGELSSPYAVYRVLGLKPEILESAHFAPTTIENALAQLVDNPFDSTEERFGPKDQAALAVIEHLHFDSNATVGRSSEHLLGHVLAHFGERRAPSIRGQQARMASWLLDHGADAKGTGDSGKRTLLRAFLFQSMSSDNVFPADPMLSVVRALIAHGATVDISKDEVETVREPCPTSSLFVSAFHRAIVHGAKEDDTLTASTPSEKLILLAAKSPPKTTDNFIDILAKMVALGSAASELALCVREENRDPSAVQADVERFLPETQHATFRRLIQPLVDIPRPGGPPRDPERRGG